MSTSGTDRLVGIRAKIERAKRHFGELGSAIESFLRSNPYRVSREDGPQPGDLCHVVHILASIPVEFPVIAGDVLHNLRSAMDHIVGQLVEANGGTIEKHHFFPVVELAKNYQSSATRALDGVRQEAIDLIAGIKPYKGGNDYLWYIHYLNNIDKHRLLLPAATYSQSLEVGVQGARIVLPSTVPLAFDDGKPLLIIRAEARDCPMFHEPSFIFDVAFAEPDDLRGIPLRETLAGLIHAVERLVDQFVPFL